jgi:hypothetical protein
MKTKCASEAQREILVQIPTGLWTLTHGRHRQRFLVPVELTSDELHWLIDHLHAKTAKAIGDKAFSFGEYWTLRAIRLREASTVSAHRLVSSEHGHTSRGLPEVGAPRGEAVR